MRLDNQKPSDNVEDRRGESGSFGPGSGGMSDLGGRGGGLGGGGGLITGLLPLLFRTIGLRGIILLAVVYFGLKFFVGIDLINMFNGGGFSLPGGTTQIELPDTTTNAQVGQADGGGISGGGVTGNDVTTTDAGKDFVARVLGSTEDVWSKIFNDMGQQYQKAPLVLFSGYTQSGCGTAQSQMGPFYCPADNKVYIDLVFYQDMKNKLGAPGDFAQAYVIAHEVGHHVQTLFGISDKVQAARARSSATEGNMLSVRMELQADCFAGIWATEANATKNIQIENGDIEEALNAASQIGDDRIQKRSQGYAVPDSFTHGSSAQRVKWFKQGLSAQTLKDCDTFSADPL